MKTVDSKQFAANIDHHLDGVLSEAIVLTQAGSPCAIVRGLSVIFLLRCESYRIAEGILKMGFADKLI
jgi:hypothetical protein